MPLCKCVKCTVLHKRDGLQLIICARYSSEMALNVGLMSQSIASSTGKECGIKQGKLMTNDEFSWVYKQTEENTNEM